MALRAEAIRIAAGTRFGCYDVVSRRYSGAVSDIWVAIPAPSPPAAGGAPAARVALKTLEPHLSAHDACRERFAQEIALHVKLHHPNIVRCVDVGTVRGSDYLALEYVEGLTLRELLEISRPRGIPIGVALRVIGRLCEALEYLHEQRGPRGALGLVHCDVCPENVMIDGAGEVKLIDFGWTVSTQGAASSKPRTAFPETSMIASRTDPHIGRLHYVAPERVQGTGLDRRSDVYAAGVMLFELVYGATPFAADGMSELVSQICSGQTRPPEERVEPDIAPLVAQAMNVDPGARIPTARDLGEMALAASAWLGCDEERVGRLVRQGIALGAPVLDLEQEPDTLRPSPGTPLDHEVKELVRATRESDAPPPSQADAQAAAVQFDRGWRALRAGHLTEALAAWEAALALDPGNGTYSVDVQELRKTLQE